MARANLRLKPPFCIDFQPDPVLLSGNAIQNFLLATRDCLKGQMHFAKHKYERI